MKRTTYDAGSHKELYVSEQTVSELAKAYSEAPSYVNARHIHVGEVHHEPSFYGGLTHHSQAIELVEKGWAKGAERLQALKRKLAINLPAPVSRKRKQVWKDDGDSLDVDRALAAQWDTAYRTTEKRQVVGPGIIEIGAQWGGSAARSADQLFWQGAALLVLADLLEEAGYSVRMWGAILGQDSAYSGKTQVHKVIVKDAGETLRVDAIAGVLCHAGVYRTLGFRTHLTTSFYVGEGLGAVLRWSDVRETLKKHGEWPDNVLILDEDIKAVYSEDDAVRAIKAAIKKLETRSANV
jgi:hypothetical protein